MGRGERGGPSSHRNLPLLQAFRFCASRDFNSPSLAPFASERHRHASGDLNHGDERKRLPPESHCVAVVTGRMAETAAISRAVYRNSGQVGRAGWRRPPQSLRPSPAAMSLGGCPPEAGLWHSAGSRGKRLTRSSHRNDSSGPRGWDVPSDVGGRCARGPQKRLRRPHVKILDT